ncbi:unnamed protein product [Ceutorhynchus assimilis]|uniref:Zinc transporter foi n=1 Tax=Ceutorhynchus assimilis TaxID=467358 RepID=A0A9N9QAF1_9CUCU|nr:unnamed protein product [Ceutorhynchus assimilis]
MAHHLLSVSIFCFICATHSPCASHAAIGHLEQHRHDGYKDPNIPIPDNNPNLNLRKKLPEYSISDGSHNADPNDRITKRSSDSENVGIDNDFLRKIFLKFGDGDKMTMEGLGELLRRLDVLHIVSEKLHLHQDEHFDFKKEAGEIEQNETCFTKESINIFHQKVNKDSLNHTSFAEVCPLMVYSLLVEPCPNKKDTFDVSTPTSDIDSSKWIYSILAVLIISVCGVGALIIIPLMQKRFYKPLIQFLVALAVGTLAGDALLHLLPHAMAGNGHQHEDHSGEDPHQQNTFKGLVAMMGLTFFFVMERLILVAVKWRKKKQKHKTVPHAHVKIFDDQGERRNSTQCMDKYNTSPYCYKDIMTENSKSEIQMKNSISPATDKLETNQNMPDGDSISTPCIEAKMLPRDHEDFTVIVREHANVHHGHSHKHGHVHAAPQNYSSVAWMVIMGDGLHNFTDGMAIGAAFASGLAGGFSTTVAVFCHELPHELGDFAMLLKAGMSIKQALFYNLLSSGLCILGNLVGLYLGNTETANQWVFAAAAGTFIYIALVDMIPELSSAHDEEDNLIQCFLHLSGLLIGVGIMTVIALYEHDLKHLFHDPE